MAKKPDLSGLTKKERKEYIKDFRQGEEKKGSKRSFWSKLIIAASVIFVIGGIGYFIATTDQQSSLTGEVIEDQGRNHISPGSPHEPYNSNPPTSGPHLSNLQPCDLYNDEVPDEAVLHSLEHGAIWITYKDKDNSELVGQLREVFEEESAKVILSPRSQNESAIAVASWGRLLKLDEFDKQQILDFIQSNRNNSPEPLAQC